MSAMDNSGASTKRALRALRRLRGLRSKIVGIQMEYAVWEFVGVDEWVGGGAAIG